MKKAETIKLLQDVVTSLNNNRATHSYYENTWYSCPKEPTEGCSNDSMGKDCNCGADRINTLFDEIIDKINKHIETL